MRIAIIGFSGSGKSTLAKQLASFYQVPVVHLDSVHFKPNWEERSNDEFKQLMDTFLDENEAWVIEGNYSCIGTRRFEEADLVIYLKYHWFTCLKGVIQRYRKNKGFCRPDMAEGCEEKLDIEFLWWVVHKGRTQKKKRSHLQKLALGKQGLVFKNRKALHRYLKSLGIEVF